MRSKKLVILISGSGTNLQSFIDAIKSGGLSAEIAAVISNRPEAYGLQRASKANITTEAIDHKAFDSREAFDHALANIVDSYNPDVVVLAGFMRILSARFVRHFHGRLLNIHPSLLPKYPGLKTHQRAIDAKDKEGGATVHFVTEELDGGPPIIQAAVTINPNDDAESLAKRVLQIEHKIYPQAVQWVIEKRAELKNNKAILDGQPLGKQGYQTN